MSNVAMRGIPLGKPPKGLVMKKFGGIDVFAVDPNIYMKSRFGKKKFERYKKYVGEDEVGEYIRMFARKNPKKPIILMDTSTGCMQFLRHGFKADFEMMKFKEYIKIESDDSINQVMSGEWISKSRSSWKAVDDEDNTIEIHNDGHDPELNGNLGQCMRIHFAPKAFAHYCKQFLEIVKPVELSYAGTRIYPST